MQLAGQLALISRQDVGGEAEGGLEEGERLIAALPRQRAWGKGSRFLPRLFGEGWGGGRGQRPIIVGQKGVDAGG